MSTSIGENEEWKSLFKSASREEFPTINDAIRAGKKYDSDSDNEEDQDPTTVPIGTTGGIIENPAVSTKSSNDLVKKEGEEEESNKEGSHTQEESEPPLPKAIPSTIPPPN